MTTTTRRRLHPGLLALAMGGFGIGLTEFSITGLLSDVAGDLGVSIPAAGGLVTGYALGVVVGAFTVTLALVPRPPKTALLILLALFVAGNALSAVGPSYELVMAGRILAALCHGGFFGIGAVLAARLVTPDRQASAIALMFVGLTVANVLGVPAGTALGHRFGWRATFVAVAVIGLVAMAAIVALVPNVPAETTSVRSQLAVLLRPSVWIACAVTALVFGGLFGAFTYIEPLLRSVTGFGAGAIPWLLVLFGLGLLVLLAAQVQLYSPKQVVLGSGLRRGLIVAWLLTLAQVALGGWVSTNYAVLACSDFPSCRAGDWWPATDFAAGFTLWRHLGVGADGSWLPFEALTAIHLSHRIGALVLTLALLALIWRLAVAGQGRWSRRLAAVLGLQIATGLSNVVLDWPIASALMHTGGAALLLSLLSVLLMRTKQ